MVDRSMKGVYPIIVTPFDPQGRIDVEDLQAEIEWLIRAGTHGIGVAMATEVLRLTEAERELVTKTVVEQAKGRVPVVINSGAQSTVAAVQYGRRAEEQGADALMAIAPALAAGEQMFEHFAAIAAAVKIPIFLQDAGNPGIPTPIAARLARETGNCCYAKVESAPPPQRVGKAVEDGGPDLIVFGGASGGYIIEELRRGSVGTMPHVTATDLFRRVWDLWHAGKEDEAEDFFNTITPILRCIGQEGGLTTVKESLRMRGVWKATSTNTRHPAARPEQRTLNELERIVERLDLRKVHFSG